MDIISMAQQARPNPSGHSEFLRAQFTALSSCVKMMPSSASSFPRSSGRSSVTFFPSIRLIALVQLNSFSHAAHLMYNEHPEGEFLRGGKRLVSTAVHRGQTTPEPCPTQGIPVS